MKRRSPNARRELAIGAAVALATLLSAVLFDLPWLATSVFPGVWLVLRGNDRRCASPRHPSDRHTV